MESVSTFIFGYKRRDIDSIGTTSTILYTNYNIHFLVILYGILET